MTTDRAPKEARDQKNRRQEAQSPDEAFQIEAAAPLHPDHATMLHLQRTIGNQAVQRLVAQGRLDRIHLRPGGLLSVRAIVQPKTDDEQEDEHSEDETDQYTDSRIRMSASPPSSGDGTAAHTIMREPDAGVVVAGIGDHSAAAASAPGPTTNGATASTQTTSYGVSVEVARQLAFAASVMRHVPKLSEEQQNNIQQLAGASSLVNMIQERDALAQTLEYERETLRLAAQLEPGESLPGGVALSADQVDDLATQVDEKNARIQDALAANGIASEAEFHRLIREFPQRWIYRAKQIAYTMLDQNRQVVQQEQGRYQANVCSPDVEGLLAADQDLGNLSQEIQTLRLNIDTAQMWLPSAGVDIPKLPENMESIAYYIQRLPESRQQLEEKTALFERKMQTYALKFPILWSKDYTPGSLSQVSSEEMERLTGQWAQDVLDNIASTEENIADDTIKVWDLREVSDMTYHDLGISENSFLGITVQNYIRGQISDAFWLKIAVAALAITAGLIATFATGGVALFAAGAAVGLSAWQLIDDVKTFRAESAAENVALDHPIIADISKGEPEILWVVLDVVGLGLDVGGVVGTLRASARAVQATGDIAEFASEARRLAETGEISEEAAEELIASAQRHASSSASSAPPTTVKPAPGVAEVTGLPKFNSRQQGKLNRIVALMEEHAIDWTELGFKSRDEVAAFFASHGNVDDAVATLEARLQRKLDIKGVHAEAQSPGATSSHPSQHPGIRETDAPQLPKKGRLPQATDVPNANRGGMWGGERGNSEWFSDMPSVNRITNYEPIPFRNGYPDFTKWARKRVIIRDMTGVDATDFAQADRILAKQGGFANQTAVAEWRSANRLTWHHMEDGETMLLVPRDLHENVPHIGGASLSR